MVNFGRTLNNMEKPAILHIKTLDGNWCDKDIIILHACFQLLTDFVEQENAFTGHVNWHEDPAHQSAKEEILQLYNWWTTRKILDSVDGINDLEKDQYKEDSEMLIRLVNIRQFLWI